MFAGLDIDWFAFGESGTIIHFASGGGYVPDFVDDKNSALATEILSLPIISPDFIISKDLTRFISINDNRDNYIKSFIEYAKRGFFSYDKSLLNDYDNSLYHLVASPNIPLDRNHLPYAIENAMISSFLLIDPSRAMQIDLRKCQ